MVCLLRKNAPRKENRRETRHVWNYPFPPYPGSGTPVERPQEKNPAGRHPHAHLHPHRRETACGTPAAHALPHRLSHRPVHPPAGHYPRRRDGPLPLHARLFRRHRTLPERTAGPRRDRGSHQGPPPGPSGRACGTGRTLPGHAPHRPPGLCHGRNPRGLRETVITPFSSAAQSRGRTTGAAASTLPRR